MADSALRFNTALAARLTRYSTFGSQSRKCKTSGVAKPPSKPTRILACGMASLSDKPTITVHLFNISDKEVTAFNLSVQQTLPDGKTFKPSAHTEDVLGGYLLHGKAFLPNSTVDVQMGKILVQIPKPVDETMVVDVVIYADGTAQVQNQDRFKDIMDQRTARFQTLEKLTTRLKRCSQTRPLNILPRAWSRTSKVCWTMTRRKLIQMIGP